MANLRVVTYGTNERPGNFHQQETYSMLDDGGGCGGGAAKYGKDTDFLSILPLNRKKKWITLG